MYGYARLKVRVSPGVSGPAAANPYLSIVFNRVRELGADVKGWDRSNNVEPFNILHIQWPNLLLGSKASGLSRARGLAWLAYLDAMRLRGAKIVWTAHNLRPHRMVMSESEWDRIFVDFSKRLDGIIHLTRASKTLVSEVYPNLSAVATVVAPHPHYGDVVPLARAVRSPGRPVRRLLVVGRVQAYKQLPAAVQAVRQLAPQGVSLTVAGDCADQKLGNELQALRSDSIDIQFRHVPDEELPTLAGEHDAMLIPQGSFLNSGVIFMSLTLGLPVVVASTPVTEEIADDCGSSWVRLFERPLTPDGLSAVLGQAPVGQPDLSMADPDSIAQRHLELYTAIS